MWNFVELYETLLPKFQWNFMSFENSWNFTSLPPTLKSEISLHHRGVVVDDNFWKYYMCQKFHGGTLLYFFFWTNEADNSAKTFNFLNGTVLHRKIRKIRTLGSIKGGKPIRGGGDVPLEYYFNSWEHSNIMRMIFSRWYY